MGIKTTEQQSNEGKKERNKTTHANRTEELFNIFIVELIRPIYIWCECVCIGIAHHLRSSHVGVCVLCAVRSPISENGIY